MLHCTEIDSCRSVVKVWIGYWQQHAPSMTKYRSVSDHTVSLSQFSHCLSQKRKKKKGKTYDRDETIHSARVTSGEVDSADTA